VTSEAITIVSGLPRSGTSMMMKMLEAGGLPVLTDEIRTADADNPRGYYEFERVKQIETDNAWLPEARGKAVKMIAALLKHLPPDYRYRVIFMQRKMEELSLQSMCSRCRAGWRSSPTLTCSRWTTTTSCRTPGPMSAASTTFWAASSTWSAWQPSSSPAFIASAEKVDRQSRP